jgi:hypothetical protein
MSVVSGVPCGLSPFTLNHVKEMLRSEQRQLQAERGHRATEAMGEGVAEPKALSTLSVSFLFVCFEVCILVK